MSASATSVLSLLLLIAILAARIRLRNQGPALLAYLEAELVATAVIEAVRYYVSVDSLTYLLVWSLGQIAVMAFFLRLIRFQPLAILFGLIVSVAAYLAMPERPGGAEWAILADAATRFTLGLSMALGVSGCQQPRITGPLAIVWLALSGGDFGFFMHPRSNLIRSLEDVLPCIIVVGGFLWIAWRGNAAHCPA